MPTASDRLRLALKVFEEAVRLLNLVRTADRITPSETVEDGNYRKRWFEESFHLKVSDLEEIFPGGNWEQRVREEASRRFPEK